MVRHFVDLFALAPILIPSVVFVAGWILLLGPKNGMLNLLPMQYFGLAKPPFNIYSFSGMVWVATLQEMPLAFLWLWPAFRAMNPDLEEAALVAGAGPGMMHAAHLASAAAAGAAQRLDHLLHLFARRADGAADDRPAGAHYSLFDRNLSRRTARALPTSISPAPIAC